MIRRRTSNGGGKGVRRPGAAPDKFGTVMQEYHDGNLHSSSGQAVTNPQQAEAIAASESGMPKRRP